MNPIPLPHLGERLRIGEILVRRGTATSSQVETGLREQRDSGERLGRCLVRLGYLSEDLLLSTLSEQLGLERIDLARLEVPAEARKALPLDFVRRQRVLPVALLNGTIRIATADPGNAR